MQDFILIPKENLLKEVSGLLEIFKETCHIIVTEHDDKQYKLQAQLKCFLNNK